MKNSFRLLKESWNILKKDRRLVCVPLLSFLVVISFAIPLLLIGFLLAQNNQLEGNSPVLILYFFIFYFIMNIIVTYFNVVLIGNVLSLLEGNIPKWTYSFKLADARIKSIIIYALFISTIAFVFDLIKDKLGIFGKVIAFVGDLTWSLISYLAIPLIAAENLSPLNAIKESSILFKKTWGEQVSGQFNLSIIGVLLILPITLIGVCFLIISTTYHFATPVIVLAVLIIILLLLLILIFYSTLNTIYKVALYRYATSGKVPFEFDEELITHAFEPKK